MQLNKRILITFFFSICFFAGNILFAQSKDLIVKDVDENGLVGKIALPDTLNKFPAIITLKGTGGGLSMFYPNLFGKHGYVVLSLAYSGISHLPKLEKEIPLEYFEKAVQWLKKHPNVDSSRLGIIGTSRGAEGALVFTSKFPVFKALVSVVGSNVVWQGDPSINDSIPTSRWSYQGKPVIPYVTLNLTKEIYEYGMKTGLWGDMFSLKNKKAVKRAEIPVEKINAPILLFSGSDDAVWSSGFMSNAIVKRLKKKKYPFEYRHISYPETGHLLFVSKDGKTGGGTGKGAQFADDDSQKQIISFFNKYLK